MIEYENARNSSTIFYEVGKCKLVSKEHKQHMIENGMLDLVVKYNHLFENEMTRFTINSELNKGYETPEEN